MWVADDDGNEAAERVDPVDGVAVEDGDAVPQDVSSRCLDKNCALADGKLGFGSEGYEIGGRGDGCASGGVIGLQGTVGGERLASRRDILSC